jgi:hypothetical protein
MPQSLLRERFHLALHHEIKQLQGYELVRDKTKLKLKPSAENGPNVEPTEAPKTDANGFPRLSAPGLIVMEGVRGSAVIAFLTARAQPIPALVERLSREFRLPVTDHTGLTGKFDFTLEFAPQAAGRSAQAHQRRPAAVRPQAGAQEDSGGCAHRRQRRKDSYGELGAGPQNIRACNRMRSLTVSWPLESACEYGPVVNHGASAEFNPRKEHNSPILPRMWRFAESGKPDPWRGRRWRVENPLPCVSLVS